MQREWKDRVLEALEIALKVAHRRRRGTRKPGKPIGPEEGSHLLGEGEREAVGILILSRVMLQMESSLRGHPNYRKACRILEELPLWSLDKETALKVIDTLSSILGLPFRYAPRPFRSDSIEETRVAHSEVAMDSRPRPFQKPFEEEAGAARSDVANENRSRPPVMELTEEERGTSDDAGIVADVRFVVYAKIERVKELLGVEGIVK